ncbi:MATE family efflux transporter, partial [Clostridium phoceensis]|uniref:MATE family efflux transporter n=1 Tax=Clostridium phoceensis TaxID=1650661 RepID=UPI00067F18D1
METAALTRGSIPPQLVSLALPLIFGNILQQLYNTIDAMVIGRFAGETAFAAIGVAGTVMNLFLFLLSGCCTGISVLFAQQYGSRDLAGFRQEGFLASVFGGLFTLVLSLAALLLLRPLLTLMQTPEDVARLAADYLVVIFGGLLATFFYNLCAAALRSVGDTRSALLALLAAMAANLALDLLFVARLGMGIAGAAWATVLAQLLSVALCLLYLARRYPQLLFRREDRRLDRGLFRREDRRLDRGLLRRTVSYGAVSALHQSSLYIGKLLVQGAVNSMGTPMISAYTATTRIEGFANSFGDSGAQAVSVFTAQNTGAGEERRGRGGGRTSLFINGLFKHP